MRSLKWKRILATVLAAFIAGSSANFSASAISKADMDMQNKTGQPFSSYWYPNEMLKWSPNQDKDAPFNKGSVPLQPRVNGPKQNDSQSGKAKVISLAIANQHTSSTPSQGSDNFKNYNFSYWQYIDTMVAWAGSSGEGIIVPPSADLIDSAHRNGVKILGTVFFPPAAYGGKSEWVKAFLKKDSSNNFVMADKLLECADYYGFDGWFINQETAGLNEAEATEFKKFMAYLQQHKHAGSEIMWYDSMIQNGDIDWQDQLDDSNKQFLQDGKVKTADGMFLNFNWYYKVKWNSDYTKYTVIDPTKLQDSKAMAEKLGRNPYDVYAGIDVQANGYNTADKMNHLFHRLYPKNQGDALSLLFPKGKEPTVSLGLYCPTWTYYSSDNFSDFLKKENRFWVSESGDPRKTESKNSWNGISSHFVEKTPVTSLPFVTNFNMGNGHFYNVNGKTVGTHDWNNRSLQEIMPTYRWVVDNSGNDIKASVDYKDSYYGGSSLLLAGKTVSSGKTKVDLYAAKVPVSESTRISVVYKQPKEAKLQLALTFNGSGKEEYVDLNGLGTDWKNSTISLGKYAGKTLTDVSICVNGKKDFSDYKLNLGRLSITNGSASSAGIPKNLKINEAKFREDYFASVRLSWNKASDNVQQYEIYRVKSDGSREFVGATPNTVYYVPEIKRDETEKEYQFVVRAVNKNFVADKSNEATVKGSWPVYPVPKASFTVSSRIAAPGEEITLTSTSSVATKSLEWRIEGAVPDHSTANQVKVKFAKEGVYSVSLTAKNSAGQDIESKTDFITISNDAKGGVKNLALNKPVTASGFTNENEAPAKGVDGTVKTKWCTTNQGDKWLTVDLGKKCTITEFAIDHAEAGGEAASMNTSDYQIQISDDAKNWKTVVNVKNNTKAVTHHQIDYTSARYARLYITQAENGSGSGGAARIYEFKVNGIDSPKLVVPKNAVAQSALLNSVYNAQAVLSQHQNQKPILAKQLKQELSKAQAMLLDSKASDNSLKNEKTRLDNAVKEFLAGKEPTASSATGEPSENSGSTSHKTESKQSSSRKDTSTKKNPATGMPQIIGSFGMAAAALAFVLNKKKIK